MNLDEVIARIDALDDELVIHARAPWTGASDAFVGSARGRLPDAGLDVFCIVRDAKGVLQHYVGDPAAMRLARVVAHAEVVRARRTLAEADARTFWYRAQPVGTFETGVLPLRPGCHRYTALRCDGHRRMTSALRRKEVVRCGLPGRVGFRVHAIPERGLIEIDEVTG